jgi:phosphoglycerate dehydrogenase-like enzyme
VSAIASAESYARGVRVCSANDVMARYVAEGALAYMLCGMKRLAQHDSWMKRGELWRQETHEVKSLYGGKVGLVGLGTIGRQLLELLRPFAPQIRLYDPYVRPESLAGYPNVTLCSLEEALAFGDAVSIHASLTSETRGMIGLQELKLLRDGAVLINTARGAIVDEAALAEELATGRISAILDVFEKEPLPLTSPLRALENVTLLPHMAGSPVREQMAMEMTEEISRFLNGKPLLHEIPYERFLLMTRE